MDNATNQNADNENTDTQNNKSGEQNASINMTQDQLNELINKKYAKGAEKAKAELLETLGIDSVDNLKSLIEQQKAQEEAQKSELQKAQEQLEVIQKEKEALEKQANEAQRKSNIVSLAAQHGITDVDYFEFEYSKKSKGEDFNADSFIEGLKESKPYMFGQTKKPKTDNSSNNQQNGEVDLSKLSFNELKALQART